MFHKEMLTHTLPPPVGAAVTDRKVVGWLTGIVAGQVTHTLRRAGTVRLTPSASLINIE